MTFRLYSNVAGSTHWGRTNTLKMVQKSTVAPLVWLVATVSISFVFCVHGIAPFSDKPLISGETGSWSNSLGNAVGFGGAVSLDQLAAAAEKGNLHDFVRSFQGDKNDAPYEGETAAHAASTAEPLAPINDYRFLKQLQQEIDQVVQHHSHLSPMAAGGAVAAAPIVVGGPTVQVPSGRIPVEERPSAAVLNLSGKIAFVAGVSDASGFGWAIAKALHKAGATVLAGTWVPMVVPFEKMLESKTLDRDRVYDTAAGPATGMLSFAKIYPLDVAYDDAADIPDDVKTNRRYAPQLAAGRGFSIAEVAAQVAQDFGRIDYLVHSIANGPEVGNPLLATSRKGYLAAQASSAYSLTSMIQRFGPLMAAAPGNVASGAVLSLTYIASERVVPGYGGGMSSAKASLESDTRTLAYEAGRAFGVRVNTISAGPLKSRAANAIKKPREAKSFIDYAIAYNKANSPLGRELLASDVADSALFLLAMGKAVTGTTLYVDNGMHVMGMATDSLSLSVQ